MTPFILIPIPIVLLFFLKLLSRLRLSRAARYEPPADETSNADSAAADVDALETVFSTFDSDGDGFITSKELEGSLRRLGLSATSEDVGSMMEGADANGDGLIDADEFRALHDSLYRHEEAEGEEELREAFHVFDGNGDGLITVEELGSVLATMGLTRGAVADECRDMIRKVDLDGDGMVNFAEFKRMMTRTERAKKIS